MPIEHRYLSELNSIEDNQHFCNQPINKKSKLLIIGTFNPNDISCNKENDATWFYGRRRNLFWKYLPECLNGHSLHLTQGFNINQWREFCVNNKIVIVDLLKQINHPLPLEDFKDSRLNDRINNQLENVTVFNFGQAFSNVIFEKIIYTRKCWNPIINKDISKLIQVKNSVNNILLQNGIINELSQIKYCPAPWQQRQTTQAQWREAINE